MRPVEAVWVGEYAMTLTNDGDGPGRAQEGRANVPRAPRAREMGNKMGRTETSVAKDPPGTAETFAG